MNFDGVEKIAAAILYEGYILYPYRPTAIKNRQRWNFGTLYPRMYAEAQRPEEAFRLVAECLVVADTNASLDLRLSFLQLVRREDGSDTLTDPSLAWEEAIERSSEHSGLRLSDLIASPISLTLQIDELQIALTIGGQMLESGACKLRLEVQNTSPLPAAPRQNERRRFRCRSSPRTWCSVSRAESLSRCSIQGKPIAKPPRPVLMWVFSRCWRARSRIEA